jgi:glycolate oxidase FAD binding subunit
MPDFLEELKAATGGHAAVATSDDAVAGMPARWVARPGSTVETSAVLKAAAAHGHTVVARGGGTKLAWGVPPERVDIVVDTTRMDAVVEHAAGDLIVVVGAGKSLAELQGELGQAGQRLGVDPARSGTVGGAVATAATGPTRLFHGAVRDLVIGMRFVRADGVAAHAGGKVVKNVAGYDLGKLLTGSLGTLGVITEVAFRLHPVPAAQRWVTCPVSESRDIQQAVSAIVHSQLVASGVELDRAPNGATLAVLFEGIPPGVEERVADAKKLLGVGATDSGEPPDWWRSEPEAGGVLIKVTHEIARLQQLLEALDAATDAAGLASTLRGSPAVGTALVGVRGRDGSSVPAAEAVRDLVARLRERSGSFGGTVVVLEAPDEVRGALDVWGPVGALDLMRSVKEQFDPDRRLAPGRFVGGI